MPNPIHDLNPKYTSPDNAMVQAIATGANDGRVGVYANSPDNTALYAQSTNSTALYAAGRVAAQFTGAVQITGDTQHAGMMQVTGDINVTGHSRVDGTIFVKTDIVLAGGDCAEEFDLSPTEDGEAGTVMVIDEGERLSACAEAYDQRVAGVIAGAGEYSPGLILDRRASQWKRRPITILGKVCCKVDAAYGSIQIGDLLTTSPNPGHAMKASDRSRAFGATIGKALRSLSEGTGLIPILVSTR